jgi:atypical dual specificity phosphatase
MTEPIVHLRSFSLKYRRKTVLASIDLDVFRGEPHVLIGPVAAGKSSLLRSLAGLHAEDATIGGTALIAGTPISEVNRGLIVGQRAATLMGSLRDCLAPRENGGVAASLAQRNARAEEALERFGLRHLASDLDTPVLALSTVDARLVLLAHFAAAAPPLLALDEPTAGMSHADVFRYCAAVRLVAQRIPLVVATHHQITARELGGAISLLAGGRIVESRATAAFFEAPLTETGRQYVRTGSCPSPSPDTRLEDVDPELRARFPELFGALAVSSPSPQPVRAASLPTPAVPFTTAELEEAFDAPSTARPPLPTPTRPQISRGTALVPRLHPIWVHEERPTPTAPAARFGGCRRPGLLAPLAEDLWDLREAGVDVLISLEAEHELSTPDVEAASIEHRTAPFADMHAPAAHDMIDLCIALDGLFAAGKSVCVHCRAGLGRTGTVLAAYLLWKGHSVEAALQKIRAKEPKFVSTETQERFLRALDEAIGHTR